jgi:hypothetical protein
VRLKKDSKVRLKKDSEELHAFGERGPLQVIVARGQR